MNSIEIEKLQQMMRIGVSEEERAYPQMIILDLKMKVDIEKSFASDNLEDTLDYIEVVNLISSSAERSRWNLLEKMCSDIGQKILSEFSVCQQVSIKASKQVLPNAKSAAVSINIER